MAKLYEDDIIEVQGDVFLKDLEAGKYRIAAITTTINPENKIYAFCKVKGNRIIATHYASSVDRRLQPVNHPDINKIVWLMNDGIHFKHSPYNLPPELRMRRVAPIFSDGSYLITNANGTNESITEYYLDKPFEQHDGSILTCTKVLFLDIGKDALELSELFKNGHIHKSIS